MDKKSESPIPQGNSQPIELADLLPQLDADKLGREMHDLARELFPICRSITGNGVRESLKILQRVIPLQIHEIPSGTDVFDWTIPREWNIRDGWVKDPRGEKIIDFQKSNLQVVNYSRSIHAVIPLAELKAHLHTLPDHPDWIPYRTSYYQETWGFCMSHRKATELVEGNYEVLIDSTSVPGYLTYGEYCLEGETDEEVLLSCHICHPSLANDNLSGVTLVALLAQQLSRVHRRFGYRFLFIPGTIGSIAWLAQNESRLSKIRHGMVVACVGDTGAFHYKRSRRGNAEIDRVVAHVLGHSGQPHVVRNFSPYGYDERQYCSPGFNLPVGSLTRTPHGEYPEYHTSADNVDFIRPMALGGSLQMYLTVLNILEFNKNYVSINPKAEPQLGKRGLYRLLGGSPDSSDREMAMLWLLNQADGTNSLLDIADRSGLSIELLRNTAMTLVSHGLLI